MTTQALPYRSAVTEGPYAGTTFVYLAGGRVISYRTGSPSCYFEGPPREGDAFQSARHDMTAEALASFNAIPERASA